jgi:nitrate reductase gamma subunit
MNLVFAVLFYAATVILVGGLAYRIYEYARTPAPLKIPTTPAPTTSGGVAFRMFREVVFFESLFKSNLWIWALGWLFHVGLALVLLRHLRYFTEPVNFIIAFIQPFGMYAGFAMAAGLAGLWARRFLVERIRYISTPSDHLMLALLLGIAVTGLADEVRHAHRHRRREDLLPRPDGVRNQSAAGAPRPLPASGHGRAADDRVPGQQTAARTRRVLLADPQPGRQPARNAPPGALGGQLDTKN